MGQIKIRIEVGKNRPHVGDTYQKYQRDGSLKRYQLKEVIKEERYDGVNHDGEVEFEDITYIIEEIEPDIGTTE